MGNGSDWTRPEVEACVADYRQMLTLELNGQRYNKTEHANVLMRRLNGRSRSSIEFKHCNITAVMLDLGYPSIRGYKRRGNYQALLLEVIEEQIERDTLLQAAAQAAVLRPAVAIGVEDFGALWVPAPKATHVSETPAVYVPQFSPARRDYLAQESRNRSLGTAGELFVVELETRRLHASGKKALSQRVEHVAATRGDGLGFDVLSFDNDGRERLIEVKTTAFGQFTPFFVTRNELARSEADSEHFHLYRLFEFRDHPRLFDMHGPIAQGFRLDPVTYLARVG